MDPLEIPPFLNLRPYESEEYVLEILILNFFGLDVKRMLLQTFFAIELT